MAISKKPDMSQLRRNSEQAARLLKTAGNPHRLMILCTLTSGEMSVGDINERIDLSQSALSQHLARLREMGLVRTRREAQSIYYSLSGNEVRKLMDCLYEIFCA